jgi:tetratricopeptide (TPR) repeat protein
MNLKRSLFVICCLTTLLGCSTTVFRSTSDDPSRKLREAVELFSSKDEPVQAEKLLHDVIVAYEKNQDDLGLAEAYRQFGLFYRSNAVSKFEKYYRKEGFIDKSVKFSTRYEKAIEYFNKAKDIFATDKQFNVLSNLQLSIAKTYDLMDQHEAACKAIEQGMENHLAYKQAASPEDLELHAEEITNYEQYIGLMKKQTGCL